MTLRDLRAEHGRADEPFETVVICTDARSADDYAALEALGVTTVLVRPWPDDVGRGDLATKQAALERFADRILDAMP
jgi:hypothetical protein